MEMKKLTLMLFVLLLAIGGCSKEKKMNKSLEGIWREDHGKYKITFTKETKSGGKFQYNAFVQGQSWGTSGNYTIEDGVLDLQSHPTHIDEITDTDLYLSQTADESIPSGHFKKQ